VDRLQMILLKDELRQWQWHPSNWWYGIRSLFSEDYDSEEIIKGLELRLFANQRMLPVLVELRRYYNENGQWPETLEEIKTKVPKLALIDPYTEVQFVYKKEGDGFRLYSKGKNRIDENGFRAGSADDFMFWPPPGYIKDKLPILNTLGLEEALQKSKHEVKE
jgi:hypothetical protein